MAKRKFQLSTEQNQELQAAYHQSKDAGEKMRYQAVRLYGNNYPVEEVIEITGCSRRRLLAWCRDYQRHGIGGLIDGRVGGNSAKLSAEQLEAIPRKLYLYRPNQILRTDEYSGNGEFWGTRELAILLKREYQVVYHSANSYRNLLRQCELSRQRPAQQYKSRNELKVATFEEALEKNCSTQHKPHPIR
jgi:transposase